jgi:Smg-4/UPF3 family
MDAPAAVAGSRGRGGRGGGRGRGRGSRGGRGRDRGGASVNQSNGRQQSQIYQPKQSQAPASAGGGPSNNALLPKQKHQQRRLKQRAAASLRPPRVAVRLAVRGLPPGLTAAAFAAAVEESPGTALVVHKSFMPGEVGGGAGQAPARLSVGYLAFSALEDAEDFADAMRGSRFVDENSGSEYVACVERSLNQAVPRANLKSCLAAVRTIASDPEYLKFVANYEEDGRAETAANKANASLSDTDALYGRRGDAASAAVASTMVPGAATAVDVIEAKQARMRSLLPKTTSSKTSGVILTPLIEEVRAMRRERDSAVTGKRNTGGSTSKINRRNKRAAAAAVASSGAGPSTASATAAAKSRSKSCGVKPPPAAILHREAKSSNVTVLYSQTQRQQHLLQQSRTAAQLQQQALKRQLQENVQQHQQYSAPFQLQKRQSPSPPPASSSSILPSLAISDSQQKRSGSGQASGQAPGQVHSAGQRGVNGHASSSNSGSARASARRGGKVKVGGRNPKNITSKGGGAPSSAGPSTAAAPTAAPPLRLLRKPASKNGGGG